MTIIQRAGLTCREGSKVEYLCAYEGDGLFRTGYSPADLNAY